MLECVCLPVPAQGGEAKNYKVKPHGVQVHLRLDGAACTLLPSLSPSTPPRPSPLTHCLARMLRRRSWPTAAPCCWARWSCSTSSAAPSCTACRCCSRWVGAAGGARSRPRLRHPGPGRLQAGQARRQRAPCWCCCRRAAAHPNGPPPLLLPQPPQVQSLCFSPDGAQLALGGVGHSVYLARASAAEAQGAAEEEGEVLELTGHRWGCCGCGWWGGGVPEPGARRKKARPEPWCRGCPSSRRQQLAGSSNQTAGTLCCLSVQLPPPLPRALLPLLRTRRVHLPHRIHASTHTQGPRDRPRLRQQHVPGQWRGALHSDVGRSAGSARAGGWGACAALNCTPALLILQSCVANPAAQSRDHF